MAGARVLVVDDDPFVLRIVAMVLQRAGYETVTAAGPLQALEMVTIKGGFDLVVSDVIMPVMCGPELADQIRLLSPSANIMLMTGCASEGLLPKGFHFIGKPFSPSDLLRAVESALQASAPPRSVTAIPR
jgi:two-component system cell cycle sensor histidine kinase/response regulator CckA